MYYDNRGRLNISFDLLDEQQRSCYEFMKNLGRNRSVYISAIIKQVLESVNAEDAGSLTKEQAKSIAVFCSSVKYENRTPPSTEPGCSAKSQDAADTRPENEQPMPNGRLDAKITTGDKNSDSTDDPDVEKALSAFGVF